MKTLARLIAAITLLGSSIFLSACSTPGVLDARGGRGSCGHLLPKIERNHVIILEYGTLRRDSVSKSMAALPTRVEMPSVS